MRIHLKTCTSPLVFSDCIFQPLRPKNCSIFAGNLLYDSFSYRRSIDTVSARHFEFQITRNFTLMNAVVERGIKFLPSCISIFPYYHGPNICQETMKLWNFLRECFMYSTELTQLLCQRLVRKPLREYKGIIEGYTPWQDYKSLDMQPAYVK